MINTIIFDFGGVISTLDPFPRVSAIFQKKYGIDKDDFYAKLKSIDNEYLLGNMSTEDFWKKSCENTPISLNEFESEIGWFEVNRDVLDLIKSLKRKYNLIILSDCYDAIHHNILKHKELTSYFDQMFYSNELHISKAVHKGEMFKYVLKKIHKKPEECIFIDDKEIHTLSAKSVGIKAIHFHNLSELKKQLSSANIIFNQN